MKKWITGLFLVSFAVQGLAQYIDQLELDFRRRPEPGRTGSLIRIEAPRLASAAAVRVDGVADWSGAFLVAGRDTFPLTLDENGEPGGPSFSHLLLFTEPAMVVEINPGSLTGLVGLFLIPADHALLSGTPDPGTAEWTTNLALPPLVDQQVWRAGLPDPNYERIFNRVRNVIIHHTATSNQVTDYTAAIRSIYLYHTQVRGWSDIGYNYLVAPNGVVYKGRDPGPYPQDEVLGAHFCASNTGTLGISLLGDYQATPPPGMAMMATEMLIAWKLEKDHLDPLGAYPHPLNPFLDVIAGHRNGCSTLCPGDQLYALLPGLRSRVHQLMIHTGIDQDLYLNESGPAVRLYPNPVRNRLIIEADQPILSIRVLDSAGRTIQQLTGQAPGLSFSDWLPGWYLVQVHTSQSVISKIIFKIH
ncbi:MAG: N-acetylmuramoyl-L-alanine amidase [Bacteroidales bacterium]